MKRHQHSGATHTDRATNASSSQPPVTPRDQPSRPTERATAPPKLTQTMRNPHRRRTYEDGFEYIEDYDVAPTSTHPRTLQLTDEFITSENDKNKENQPAVERPIMNATKRRFVDPQENAQRVLWGDDSQFESLPTSANPQKRTNQHISDESEDESDAYQQDERHVDQTRRQAVPSAAGTHVQAQPAPKRIRVQTEAEDNAERVQRYKDEQQRVQTEAEDNAERVQRYNDEQRLGRQEQSQDAAVQDEVLQASVRATADNVEDSSSDSSEMCWLVRF